MAEKIIKNCKHLKTCYNGTLGDCVGCNIWNMKYNMDALMEWCKQQDKKLFDVIRDLHEDLITEKENT